MQHLGLLSFILLAIGLGITATVLPGGLGKTFSQRVANRKTAEILYSLLFITTLPLLYIFFVLWFVAALDMPSYLLYFVAVAAIFQILCTWVPERGGRMTVYHRLLTGISGVALLPVVLIVALYSNSMVTSITAWTTLVGMLLLLAIALLNQQGYKYALLLQVGYYALFFAVILLLTYVQ